MRRSPSGGTTEPDGLVDSQAVRSWPGSEEVETFTGVVLYEATDPLPSYVQRHNSYKLKTESGTWDIYMGSSDIFHPIIGWEIELRGVIETVCVEGHTFVEIWPTEYRMAGDPPE